MRDGLEIMPAAGNGGGPSLTEPKGAAVIESQRDQAALHVRVEPEPATGNGGGFCIRPTRSITVCRTIDPAVDSTE